MYQESPRSNPFVVAEAGSDARTQFIRRTYLHLAAAILLFVGLETLLLHWSGAQGLVNKMIAGRGWLLVLAAFMGVSWIANRWATSDASIGMQYLGLVLYVVAEALIFLPLIYIAKYTAPEAIPAAALVTVLLLIGLTCTVFMTKTDFSFLRTGLVIGGFVAMGIIVASFIFGFQLGIVFSGAMVLFAGASILYTTNNILRVYRTDQHVAASLALFAGIALLFWYVLRIFMSRR